MYLGRIVAMGMSSSGAAVAAYRVSSRSFPNREAREKDGTISIMPTAGNEGDLAKNPYIAYNCLRIAGDWAVASNGSHTDPITEKLLSGMNARDAVAVSLLALDYEKDDYDTPRIAALANRSEPVGLLGIVRKDALLVKEFHLRPGTVHYVATYEINAPLDVNRDESFVADSAAAACSHVLTGGKFADFERPVTAAAAMAGDGGFQLATANAEPSN